MLKTTLEQVDRFTAPDRELLGRAEVAISQAETLDQAAAIASSLLPDWFVYQGGGHVAIHRASGDPDRALLVVEVRDPAPAPAPAPKRFAKGDRVFLLDYSTDGGARVVIRAEAASVHSWGAQRGTAVLDRTGFCYASAIPTARAVDLEDLRSWPKVVSTRPEVFAFAGDQGFRLAVESRNRRLEVLRSLLREIEAPAVRATLEQELRDLEAAGPSVAIDFRGASAPEVVAVEVAPASA